MSDIPWDLILALLVPALLSVGICFVPSRLNVSDPSKQSSIIACFAACSGALALYLIGEFSIQGSPYFQIPGAVAIFMPVLAMLSSILSWRARPISWFIVTIIFMLSLGLMHVLSFPWANRGLEGWLSFGVGLLSGTLFCVCMTQALHAVNQSGNKPNSKLSIMWWALVTVASAVFLFSLTALGHAQALAICVFPIAVAGFVSWPLGKAIFGLNNQLCIAALLSLFLLNAIIRYVPSSDDPALIIWILRLSPLSLCLVAGLLLVARQASKRYSFWLQISAAILLASALSLSVFAYQFEAETESSADPSADFYQ